MMGRRWAQLHLQDTAGSPFTPVLLPVAPAILASQCGTAAAVLALGTRIPGIACAGACLAVSRWGSAAPARAGYTLARVGGCNLLCFAVGPSPAIKALAGAGLAVC